MERLDANQMSDKAGKLLEKLLESVKGQGDAVRDIADAI